MSMWRNLVAALTPQVPATWPVVTRPPGLQAYDIDLRRAAHEQKRRDQITGGLHPKLHASRSISPAAKLILQRRMDRADSRRRNRLILVETKA